MDEMQQVLAELRELRQRVARLEEEAGITERDALRAERESRVAQLMSEGMSKRKAKAKAWREGLL